MRGPSLIFFVPGPPVPKARPRTVRTKRGLRITFTPDKTTAYEHAVRAHALRAMGVAKWPRPREADSFHLEVTFFLTWLAARADLDNLVKAVADGLQPAAIRDDRQIASLQARRIIGALPHRSGVRIELTRVDEIWDEALGEPRLEP